MSKQNRIMRGRERSPVRLGEDRTTLLGRVTGVREEKRSVLLATNGEKTESEYLRGLVASPERYHAGFSKPVVKFFSGDPTVLVSDASKYAALNEHDIVFAVADTENGEPAVKVGEAQEAASKRGIEMIWSRPCMEVWLIQHHAACNGHLNNGDAAVDALRKYDRKYKKNEPFFERYVSLIPVAVRHGKLCTRDPASSDGNPSSSMWKLVEQLRTGIKPGS